MEEDIPEKYVKVVLLGDSSVGKTCLVTRFCHEEFGRQYYPTPGVDFFLKRTAIQGNRLVRAVIWDLGGKSLEGSMFQNYLHGTQVTWNIREQSVLKNRQNLLMNMEYSPLTPFQPELEKM